MTRFIFFALILLTQMSFGQTKSAIDTTDEDYVYIPKDIQDAFKVLDRKMDSVDRAIVKNSQEDTAVERLWKSGPPDFLYDWKFGDPNPSTIVKYFNNLGIFHPYDFTRATIISYNHYLNKKPIDLDKTIDIIRKERDDDYKIYLEKLSKDSINGIYIPKDLKDCFLQLDKILSANDKEAIKGLKNKTETIKYHHGLGMWIRNEWGLWGGSRLQKYFLDKKVDHPDSMSSLILEFYYDWLHSKNTEWQKWKQ